MVRMDLQRAVSDHPMHELPEPAALARAALGRGDVAALLDEERELLDRDLVLVQPEARQRDLVNRRRMPHSILEDVAHLEGATLDETHVRHLGATRLRRLFRSQH